MIYELDSEPCVNENADPQKGGEQNISVEIFRYYMHFKIVIS